MLYESPLDWFLKWEKETPDAVFLRQPFNGVWKTWTWAEAGQECRRLASAMQNLGLQPRSHVALLSKNCAQWILSDLAIMMGGYISIPIYPTLSAASIEPILVHSDAKAIILGKLDDYNGQKHGIPAHMITIGTDCYGIAAQYQYEALVAEAAPLSALYHWKHEDLFTIVYTSGTTGEPKGVMHNAGTASDVLPALTTALRLPLHPKLFSYLPLSHIAERVGIEINGLYNGAEISFAESMDSFAENLQSVQPDIFFAVPRLWAKFQEGILKKMPQRKLDFLLSIPVIGGVVKKGIQKKLGLLNASHIYSAAAPISVDIITWFQKLGISVIQGYAMTEDFVYGHFEFPGSKCLGSVGKAVPGLQVKFSEQDELLVKSIGLLKGYYKNPAQTAEVFDAEGYLKTGDKAAYNHEGYLFITGRIKDLFKTDKGKYIAPAPIELKFAANPDIDQVCVVGMGIPQPIALVTLSEIGAKKSEAELRAGFSETMQQVNPELEAFERVEKVVVMKEVWSIANGLLTPTMKIKRNEVEKIHQAFYGAWFNMKGKVIWE